MNRTNEQRRADAVRRFENDDNVWIATGAADGSPHLVPLSLAWVQGQIVVATPSNTPTVHNCLASGKARAALDSAADVVVVDASVAVVDFDQANEQLRTAYVHRVGWDPRDNPGRWSLLILTPRRVQAWNGVGEIEGRTIMRDGVWVY